MIVNNIMNNDDDSEIDSEFDLNEKINGVNEIIDSNSESDENLKFSLFSSTSWLKHVGRYTEV